MNKFKIFTPIQKIKAQIVRKFCDQKIQVITITILDEVEYKHYNSIHRQISCTVAWNQKITAGLSSFHESAARKRRYLPIEENLIWLQTSEKDSFYLISQAPQLQLKNNYIISIIYNIYKLIIDDYNQTDTHMKYQ